METDAIKTRRINYKSDFDFAVILRASGGEEIGWPEAPFTLTVTCGGVQYTASSDGHGGTSNCYRDENGRIHVVLDNHGLKPGRMQIELACELPDALYMDGSRREVNRVYVPIELVAGKGDGMESATAEVTLPVIARSAYDLAVANGYTGTQEEKRTFRFARRNASF